MNLSKKQIIALYSEFVHINRALVDLAKSTASMCEYLHSNLGIEPDVEEKRGQDENKKED